MAPRGLGAEGGGVAPDFNPPLLFVPSPNLIYLLVFWHIPGEQVLLPWSWICSPSAASSEGIVGSTGLSVKLLRTGLLVHSSASGC